MSTQYNGQGANVVFPTSLTIASMTGSGTTPTLVTTTTPHGLSTGDTVRLDNIDGNTAGNGTFPVMVTSSTQFSIPVTGNGTYTASIPGRAHPLTYGSTYAIPSDGDAEVAASVDVSLETLGDRSAVMVGATGAYKLISVGSVGADTLTSGGWTVTTGASSPGFAAANLKLVTLSSLQVGDVVEFDWTASAAATISSSDQVWLTLGQAQYAPAATPPAVTRIVNITATSDQTDMAQGSSKTIHGAFTMGVNGSIDLWPMAGSNHAGGGVVVTLANFFVLRFRVWRPTGVPQ